jgi:hypothetical protein
MRLFRWQVSQKAFRHERVGVFFVREGRPHRANRTDGWFDTGEHLELFGKDLLESTPPFAGGLLKDQDAVLEQELELFGPRCIGVVFGVQSAARASQAIAMGCCTPGVLSKMAQWKPVGRVKPAAATPGEGGWMASFSE